MIYEFHIIANSQYVRNASFFSSFYLSVAQVVQFSILFINKQELDNLTDRI